MSIPVQCVNEVIGCRSNVITPEVGMLGTYFVGSDRYAIVVAKVISPKKIFVLDVHDKELVNRTIDDNKIEWLPTDLVNEMLETKTPKEDNYVERYGVHNGADIYGWDYERFIKEGTYTFRKNGRWVEAGRGLWETGAIHLGVADPYLDPCF